MAPGGAGEVERRTAGAAGDLERVMTGGEIEPPDEALVLVGRHPAVLTDVDAERFLPNGVQDPIGEVAVGAVEEIDPLSHVTSSRKTQPRGDARHPPRREA